jgi:hypothetical protein
LVDQRKLSNVLTAVATDGGSSWPERNQSVSLCGCSPFTKDSPKFPRIYEALMLSATRRADKGMRKQFE